MSRRPRRSTLFPTRRSSDLNCVSRIGQSRDLLPAGKMLFQIGILDARPASWRKRVGHAQNDVRSEEHTSELQSRFDLVCRLLLEKKNTNIILLLYTTKNIDE